MASSTGTLVTLGAVAVGGYLLYNYLSTPSLPADAVFFMNIPAGVQTLPDKPSLPSSPGTGGTFTFTGPGYLYYSPSTGLYYANTTAPTAAQIAAGQSLTGASPTSTTSTAGGTSTSTTGTSGTGTGGTSSTTGTGGGGGETQPAAPSLASIYTSILAGVRTDPNFTVSTGGALQANTPEGMIVGTPYRWAVYLNLALPTNIPSPSLSTVFPGVDLTQPMSLSTFWGAMGPALTAQSGLAGFFAGLGAYAASMRGMGDVASDFAAASGGVDMNSWPTQADIASAVGIPVLQDSMTVTPSTAGTGYNINPTTGAMTVASGMSTTTILMLAAAGIFGFALLMGRK